MNVNNFLNFSILFSCFMGAFFSILKFTHAVDIILFFLMTSFCISIILKFGISLIVKYTDVARGRHFSGEHDNELELLRIHLNKLEKDSLNRISKIHALDIGKMMQKKR